MAHLFLMLALTIFISETAYAGPLIAPRIGGLDIKEMTRSTSNTLTREDLLNALTQPLYTKISVRGRQKPIDTCQSLIEAQGESKTFLEAQHEPDSDSLRDISTTCIAAKLILGAAGSSTSYIDAPLLTKAFFKHTPYNLAQIISDEFRERLAHRKPSPSWWDAEPVSAIDVFSENTVTLALADATQTVTVMGYGDVNGDGVEDAIIKVVDTLNPPATYFNARLYVLTKRGEQQNYSIILSYER